MGFGCGIYKAKRLKGITPKRLSIINNYEAYTSNEFSSKAYPTWESYARMMYELSPEEDASQLNLTEEEKEFYINNPSNQYKADTYSSREYTMLKDIETWCSNGNVFHDFFCEQLDMGNGYFADKEIDKEFLKEALHWVRNELESYQVHRAICRRAFVEKYHDGDYEPYETSLIPCDGVELEIIDSDDGIHRVYTADAEISELFYSRNFDEWSYDALVRLRDTIEDILLDTDFENEILLYGGGY